MKTIELTQGQVTVVDDSVYAYLMQWKWTAKWSAVTWSYHARRMVVVDGDRKAVYICHAILMYLGFDLTGLEIGYEDCDTLNNQLYNLRPCTHEEKLKLDAQTRLRQELYKREHGIV